MKFAGIGSRRTPPQVLLDMEEFARRAAQRNCILRSGGADGADSAFERGAKSVNGTCEIYLPWKNFNNNPSTLFKPTEQAYKIAASFHPKWTLLEQSVRMLMARNVHQILGQNCDDPVDFVICYTPDGCEDGTKTSIETGGTGQAIRLASSRNIPIYNLACRDYKTVLFLTDLT